MALQLGERAIIVIQYDDGGTDGYWRFELAGSATSDDLREGTATAAGIPFQPDMSNEGVNPANGATNNLTIGGSPSWANFYAELDVGEVLFYNRFLNPTNGTEYTDTITYLATKWNTGAPADPPELDASFDPPELTISWVGPATVERATDLILSNWTGMVGGDVSPFVVDLTGEPVPQATYRLGTAEPPFSPAGPLIQHLDASITSSIQTVDNTGGEDVDHASQVYVSQWNDQTVNGLNAAELGPGLPAHDEAEFPGTNLFANGLAGVDVGLETAGANGLGVPFQLLSPGQSDWLLDFSSDTNKGFSIFMVLKVDDNPGPDGGFPGSFQSYLLNGQFPNTARYGIYRNESGQFVQQMGGVGVSVNTGGSAPVGAETIVAATYDASTGDMSIENLNGGGVGISALGTGNNPNIGQDYSDPTLPLVFGCSPSFGNFYSDATFGEIRIYDAYYAPSSATYSNIMATLEAKWLSP
jgi:hypothetical protein